MKFFSALLLAFALLFSPAAIAQSQAPAPLPANVQAELAAALRAVNPTNSGDVTKAVLSIIEKYNSLAPGIVAYSVNFVGQALLRNPEAAQNVIPDFVRAAAKSQPNLAPQITFAAISAVPTALKTPVVPRIVQQVLAEVPLKPTKVAVLNAAYEAVAQNPELVTALDGIADTNKIEIVKDPANDQEAIRYFLADPIAEDEFSGDQGAINQGGAATGGFGGSGGGSGSSGGSTSGPTPTPTATPTSAPTATPTPTPVPTPTPSPTPVS